MTVQIRLIRDYKTLGVAGDVVDVTPNTASILVRRGHGVPVTDVAVETAMVDNQPETRDTDGASS